MVGIDLGSNYMIVSVKHVDQPALSILENAIGKRQTRTIVEYRDGD